MVIVATVCELEYDARNLVMAFLPLEPLDYRLVDEYGWRSFMEGEEAGRTKGKCLVLPNIHGGAWTAAYYEDGELLGRERVEPPLDGGVKNPFKRLLFLTLSHALQIRPPWGTLTGVRPTKLPLAYLLEGHGEEEAQRWMKDSFYCRDDKAALCVGVASKEREMLRDVDGQKGFSLYVGVPFCPTTCRYCSFPSYPMARYGEVVEDYLLALEREMEAVSSNSRKRPTTVYVGGGTPTSLSVRQLERLLERLRGYFELDGIREFTVEAGRPDGLTREKLKVLLQSGVNRISINPQTMKEETLRLIGRDHTVKELRESYYVARDVGFDNVNMDLIAGLPEETTSDFYDTLMAVKELNPEGVTMHSLVIKRASEMRRQKEGRKGEEGDDPIEGMLEVGRKFAKEEGYEPYYMYRQKHKAALTKAAFRENIGFARKGGECLYNVLMMEEKQTIVALGAGAVSKYLRRDGGRMERVENVKDLRQYVNRIDEMIQRRKGME